MTAIAVTIAGSDSGGGAGVQADLKSFSANGVYGASVLTALTAQNTLGVSALHDVPPDFIRAQIRAVYDDLGVNATKIGMLSRPEVIGVIAEELRRLMERKPSGCGPVVLDPVMVAASGDPLLQDAAVDHLIRELFPLADLVTPNLHEAGRILGQPVAASKADMTEQAEAILRLGARAVLLKGGHGSGDKAEDLLLLPDRFVWLEAPRIDTLNTHGTGCSLSSAIAAALAKGADLVSAVRDGKRFITGAIAASDHLRIGAGHGPVHHFHALWERTS